MMPLLYTKRTPATYLVRTKSFRCLLVLKLGKVTDTLTNYPAQYFGLLQFLSEVSVTSLTKRKIEHYPLPVFDILFSFVIFKT